jgi:hypothetical protein
MDSEQFKAESVRCRPWIEAALEYSGGTHDFIDIAEGLYKGTMQLWPAEKGCIVTEIVVYPRKKVVNVFLGGGDLEQILDMHEDVIEWGKLQGCSALTMTGRFGWKKPLAKHGWEPLHSSYVKEFD